MSEISLRKIKYLDERKAFDHIPTVYYDIVLNKDNTVVGDIDLRLKVEDEYMFYYGHIGYYIKEEYRGNHYALKACELIVKIAKEEYGLNKLIITSDPDNLPSNKTLLALGCKFIGDYDVPISHVLYYKGEKRKRVYELEI